MWQKIKSIGKKNPKKKEIIINAESLETRVAVLQDGALEDFFIERPNEDRIVGSIFKGKIQNLEDGLQAAFVDIGMKKNAFIHYWDMIPEDAARLEAEEGTRQKRGRGQGRKKKWAPGEMAKKYPIGSEIVVQVTKGAIGTKGPRVTANLSIPGRYLVLMPGSRLKGVSKKIEDGKERQRLKKVLARLPFPEGVGVIVRTAGSGAKQTSFVQDIRGLTAIWTEIERGIKEDEAPTRLYEEPNLIERVVRDSLTEDVGRIIIDSREGFDEVKNIISRFTRRRKSIAQLYEGEAPVFEYFEVEKQLENAYHRKVWLKSGGYLVFDETEALVAIDVNTGRHKGGKSQEESITQVNLEAAEEVARQLRLRNVGGLVIIDFIDMRQRRNQNLVYKALVESLKDDRARTNVLQISQLGLLEMTRQRAEESIRSATYMDCPYCDAKGKIKSPLSMSVELQRRIAQIMRRKREKKDPSLTLKVSINPSLLERLRNEDEEDLMDLQGRYDSKLTFVSNPSLHVEEFSISNDTTGEELYSNVEK